MQRNRFIRTVGVMVLLFVLAASMYAFTAENTFSGGSAGKAGIGEGDVSGYTVSKISYTFADDPATIASVSFQLDAPARDVRAKADNGDWVDCTTGGPVLGPVDGPSAWACDIDVDTDSFTSLEVAATN